MNEEKLVRALVGQRPGPHRQAGPYPGSVSAGQSVGDEITQSGISFVINQAGLLVPAVYNRRAAPIDRVVRHLTSDEIFGRQIPQWHIEEDLRRSSVRDVVHFVADVMTIYRMPGVSKAETDTRFADAWFSEPTKSRVKTLLNAGKRALVVPQALFVLLKKRLLLEYADDEESDDPPTLPMVLLGIMDGLDARDLPDEEQVLTTSPGKLGRELIANHHFNSETEAVHLIARFYYRWLTDPGNGLEELFGAATSVPLRDMLSAALGLWASVINGRPIVRIDYFEPLGWTRERAETALSLLSSTESELKDLVRRTVRDDNLNWEMSAFERFPVFLDNEQAIVLDLDLLVRRAFGWLPVFDVKSALLQTGLPEDAKRAADTIRLLCNASEQYVNECLANLVGENSRLYYDSDFERAYPSSSKADAAIDYGNSWVVVETTTFRLRREAVVAESDAVVEADLDKIVDEARQIDATIWNVRFQPELLTGPRQTKVSPIFYPVLVMTEGFPINPISITLIRERLKRAKVLIGSDTAKLEVMDVVELEMIEGLQEQGGPSLQQLLHDKQSAGLERANMRQYVLDERKLQPKRPSRVKRLWEDAVESLVSRK